MTSATAALADSVVGSGQGGNYKYQLWRTTDNRSYYLKVWRRQADKNSASTTVYFNSSREALDHFDCYYAEKSLPSCPRR